MISYELALGLSLIGVILLSGTLDIYNIVEQQSGWYGMQWNIIYQPLGFVLYLIAAIAETNRVPFDLPEAETELVAGFHTEYSSIKFAMFFLAEYINVTTVSALATTLFLGGWRAPWPLSLIDNGVLNTGWWPVLWFLAKVVTLIFCFYWLRATLPRLRYDQFMALGWKVLIPVSLAWIMIVATTHSLRTHGYGAWATGLITAGIVVALLL